MLPLCNLCHLKHIDDRLHLLSCYNQHIANLRITRHNKAIHVIANLLLMHPSTKNCTLIHASTTNNQPPNNTLASWLIPSSCYLQNEHASSLIFLVLWALTLMTCTHSNHPLQLKHKYPIKISNWSRHSTLHYLFRFPSVDHMFWRIPHFDIHVQVHNRIIFVNNEFVCLYLLWSQMRGKNLVHVS